MAKPLLGEEGRKALEGAMLAGPAAVASFADTASLRIAPVDEALPLLDAVGIERQVLHKSLAFGLLKRIESESTLLLLLLLDSSLLSRLCYPVCRSCTRHVCRRRLCFVGEGVCLARGVSLVL
jgi:hypothetical protein